jgi:hypothetical protein
MDAPGKCRAPSSGSLTMTPKPARNRLPAINSQSAASPHEFMVCLLMLQKWAVRQFWPIIDQSIPNRRAFSGDKTAGAEF